MWQKGLQGLCLWRNYFCPNFTPPFAFRDLPGLSQKKKSHWVKVKKPRGLTGTSHALGKNQGEEWGINCHCRKKENVGCDIFHWLNLFWRCLNGNKDCWGFLPLVKLWTQRSHAQRTGFVSFRCINQELLWDKIKMLSRMGKQEFIEQWISLGLITMLMGFPLLETYGYTPCKPWKGSKY